MSSIKIPIKLNTHTYNVILDDGILHNIGSVISPHLPRNKTVIVADENVWATQKETLTSSLDKTNIQYNTIIMPSGEQTKCFSQLEHLLDQLLGLNIERRDTIIAFGGGVIGDLVGFAASVLYRGIKFIQIPTTLLAQVDSSVGGKTGINSPRGKNLIGTFYQPELVIADTDVLSSLPKRQLKAGYAEIVKYALINDLPFFEWLEQNSHDVINCEINALKYAIATSVRSKAKIVAADEKESSTRALLNLGHTSGHALEAVTKYSDLLLHGEAVAIGMVIAFEISQKLGWTSREDTQRLKSHLRSVELPTRISDINVGSLSANLLWNHMQKDKKINNGKITFIMPRGIGETFLTEEIPETIVKTTLYESMQ